ncbi:FkbM family methyltransferase [Bremerella sp. JC770]|uniref:FkbM family methyltransferase n=1 Tax=Bremerella sp. JC770 TaxID=3232137 RepID=UPI003459730A
MSSLRGLLPKWGQRKVSPSVATEKREEIIEFDRFTLLIDPSDAGGCAYRHVQFGGENPLLREAITRFQPTLYVDIGANYGLTCLIHHQLNPGARIVAVEASSKLIPFLTRNLNAIIPSEQVDIVHGLCGKECKPVAEFALNPHSSQDNRVKGTNEQWKIEMVPQVDVSSLTDHQDGFVFLKVDTQGFEPEVLSGAEAFFKQTNNWFAIVEFAPQWLESQGFRPESWLTKIAEKYKVFEWPEVATYKGSSLDDIMSRILEPSDCLKFTQAIRNRRRRSLGWTDIGIIPRI